MFVFFTWKYQRAKLVAISWHWVAVMEGEVKVLEGKVEGKVAEGAREAGRDQVDELDASSKFITAQRVEGGGWVDPGPIKRLCPSHLTFSAQMCLPFFLPKQPHLRYYTIL